MGSRQVECHGIPFEIGSCINQSSQALLIGQPKLVAITQPGSDSGQPILSPKIIMQTRMIVLHPRAKCVSSRSNDCSGAGHLDRHLMRIGNIRHGQQREEI